MARKTVELQEKGWPPPAHDEFVKKGGSKWSYASDWNFTEMMIATSPFGDGREWARKVMDDAKPYESMDAASIVGRKLGLAPKAVLEWYQPYSIVTAMSRDKTLQRNVHNILRRKPTTRHSKKVDTSMRGIR